MADWEQRAEDIIDFSPNGDSRAESTLKTIRSFTHIFELVGLLHESVSTQQAEISTLQEENSTLQNEVTTLKDTVSALQARIAAFEGKVLDTEINNLQDGQVLIFDANKGKWVNHDIVVVYKDA